MTLVDEVARTKVRPRLTHIVEFYQYCIGDDLYYVWMKGLQKGGAWHLDPPHEGYANPVRVQMAVCLPALSKDKHAQHFVAMIRLDHKLIIKKAILYSRSC